TNQKFLGQGGEWGNEGELEFRLFSLKDFQITNIQLFLVGWASRPSYELGGQDAHPTRRGVERLPTPTPYCSNSTTDD
ncbi:MAG: hypothetical protein ACYT04_000000101930, partial [Nostoc sp.]